MLEETDILPQAVPVHPAPVSVQFTPRFCVSFCSVAVKFCVCPVWTEAVVGLTATVIAAGAMIVTWAEAVLEVSACAMAVTVTVAGLGMLEGAVYVPSAAMVPCTESPPTTPFTCQVTVVLALFLTVALNFCVAEVCTLTLDRFREISIAAGGSLRKGDFAVAHPESVKIRSASPTDQALPPVPERNSKESIWVLPPLRFGRPREPTNLPLGSEVGDRQIINSPRVIAK